MDLLLDTNIVIPLLNDEADLLPDTVRPVILDASMTTFVSVASLWEAVVKLRTGKLRVDAPPARWRELLVELEVEMLPIDPAHVLQDVDPLPPTKDPFDRLLLAVCAFETFKLVTIDRVLIHHPLAYRPSA